MNNEINGTLLRYSNEETSSIKFLGEAELSYQEFFKKVFAYSEVLRNRLPAKTVILIDKYKCIDSVAIAISCILEDFGYCFIDPSLPESRKKNIFLSLKPTLHIKSELGSVEDQVRFNKVESWNEKFTFPGGIVFTSGSTGLPKGVLNSKDSIGAYINSMLDVMGTNQESWLSICPAHFDVFQLDFLVQLSRGANIVSCHNNLFPQQYLNIINNEGITQVLFISTMLKLITQTVDYFESDTLKTVFFGGEGCPISVLDKVKNLFSESEFCQFYGPTENCNNTTFFYFKDPFPTHTGFMPLGKTVKNTRIIVQRKNGTQCNQGEVGEFVISGPQLFHGYLDIESGKVQEQTGEFYSGDYGECDEQGRLYFRGRFDDVVKINGNRVSLLEISNKIQTLFEDSIVSTISLQKGEFDTIVSGLYSPEHFDEDKIKDQLRTMLPHYCVPHHIIRLEPQFVRTLSTGKTDFKYINTYLKGMQE